MSLDFLSANRTRLTTLHAEPIEYRRELSKRLLWKREEKEKEGKKRGKVEEVIHTKGY